MGSLEDDEVNLMGDSGDETGTVTAANSAAADFNDWKFSDSDFLSLFFTVRLNLGTSGFLNVVDLLRLKVLNDDGTLFRVGGELEALSFTQNSNSWLDAVCGKQYTVFKRVFLINGVT